MRQQHPDQSSSLLPVLIVLHQEMSTPGRIGNALRALGLPLDIRRPRFGDPLPETLAHHAGAVIFGGPMSANDSEEYILREIDWIKVPLKEQKPFLGICLGAQMMAKALGGRVERHTQVELGWFPVELNAEGRQDPVLGGAGKTPDLDTASPSISAWIP